jgi:flagellar basal-body rod protein FlgG
MPETALNAAASGLYAQQVNIKTIANNIANINTTSFKKNRAEFKDLMYQDISTNPQNSDIPGFVEDSDATIQVGTGVKPTSTQKIFTQGNLQQTGQKLDMAIHGDGFFQLRNADGNFVYSRDGSFKLSADGSVVSSGGHLLEPGFTVNTDVLSIEINTDGVVSAIGTDQQKVEIGNIELVKFVNPGGLKALGNNLYAETDQSGIPLIGTPGTEGFGEVHQGYLESSNVDIVEEMMNMITAQRAYEINSKTVKTVDDMMTMANNLKQ